MKTVNLENVAIWRSNTGGIAMRLPGVLTSVNNIEGSKRCHKNLYDKLDKILKDSGL